MSYQNIARRLRLPLGFVLGIAYVVFARPTQQSLLIGGIVALLGVLVRAWAAGHISKNKVLATSGPYAHTRNPLYFGSFLISAGFAIAAHWLVLIFVGVFFLLIYYPTMKKEITAISGFFPDSYPKYAENVPLFLPRLTPWRGDSNSSKKFDPKLYMRHGEWKAALTYVLAMVWLAFRSVAG